MARSGAPALRRDGRHELLHTEDVEHARQIIDQHTERHLGGDLRQCLAQEVRRPHPRLHCAERMFNRLARCTHGWRVLIEPLLHFFK